MRCVTCESELLEHVHEGVRIDTCPTCNGMFVTHSALTHALRDQREPRTEAEHVAAKQSATTTFDPHAEAPDRRCPVCRTFLRRYVFGLASGVVVDGCSEHGVWLDAGELEQLEAWAEATDFGRADHVDLQPGSSDAGAATASTPATEPTEPSTPAPAPTAALDPTSSSSASVLERIRAQLDQPPATTPAPLPGSSPVAVVAAASSPTAPAGAASDVIPTAADGAVISAAERTTEHPPRELWPFVLRPEHYTSWISSLERAEIVSEPGSVREQELHFAPNYRVRQRVLGLFPERTIRWRETDAWVDGQRVTADHDGCWTSIDLQVLPEGGTRLTYTTTWMPADDAQRSALSARIPDQGRWIEASLDALIALVEQSPAQAV